jgi:hypothetical protein
MKGILTVAVLAGLLLGLATIPSRGQQEVKEKPLPITKEALLGRWEGRVGDKTAWIEFGAKRAKAVVAEFQGNEGLGAALDMDYEIDHQARVVQLVGFGEGRLVKGGRLRVVLSHGRLHLPKGTVLTLSRPTKGTGK